MFSITPYSFRPTDMFKAFDDFEKNFFGESELGTHSFKTDIKDEGNEYLLSCELPGYDKKDIKINIENNTLTVKATHSEEKKEKDKKGNYIRRERSFGSYQRSFDISNVVDDKIDAEYNNGILEIKLPKKVIEPPKQRLIEVK